ncbi:hypothetical protein Calag_1063 [Caldisphaera lagunensis DSM 15908]|uniref:Uncharacterized protein n=1 Tax=Caldisphaera lagunensis (strain DSM 15908 / JCM 11604 / ANMR 0165 / IC-154) TaxID=1056495 RepID=L0ACK1_CALLD|nr:hypothetical protein [Caldisphaera lagunensis]AFZ70785.1 hypothetical protein Calag_1063 [Caldisphaera lagunensis DSM 15908]
MSIDCNDKIVKIIESLIKKGLGKNCIESMLYFDYKISLNNKEFLNYYDIAFNCLYKIRNKEQENKDVCNNEIVKDIVLLIFKGYNEKTIKLKIYKKYSMHKSKNGEYIRLTLRDIDNYYEISKKCINYKKLSSEDI